MNIKMKAAALSVGLALGISGTIVAAAPQANAGVVPNFMKCDPATGWCYQTNPPVNNSVPHWCQWDYTLHNLWSGMWYTGCDSWGPDIH